MANALRIANSLIPISLFNQGQAARIFERLQTEGQLIVLKNNQPTAFILSQEEYERLSEIEEDYQLLLEGYERLKANINKAGIPMDDVMANHGIAYADLENVEVEIE